MKIITKKGLTLELSDNAEVRIDGDKITVGPTLQPYFYFPVPCFPQHFYPQPSPTYTITCSSDPNFS